MTTKLTRSLVVTATLLASIAYDASAQTTITNIHIDPKGAYQRLCPNHVAVAPTAIDLRALGIGAGDLLLLTSLGDFNRKSTNIAEDTATGMIAVFSSSTELGPQTSRFRVLGAIDAGPDHQTHVTLVACGASATDIPQDFYISTNGINIRVPTNALYLLVQSDAYDFRDNFDPDGDYTLSISRQCDLCASISVSPVRVCWSSESNVLYQVEYKSTLTTNMWTPLVSGVPGNGTTNCVFDAVTEEQRFYQIVRQP